MQYSLLSLEHIVCSEHNHIVACFSFVDNLLDWVFFAVNILAVFISRTSNIFQRAGLHL
jgi:hypothetical protein